MQAAERRTPTELRMLPVLPPQVFQHYMTKLWRRPSPNAGGAVADKGLMVVARQGKHAGR